MLHQFILSLQELDLHHLDLFACSKLSSSRFIIGLFILTRRRSKGIRIFCLLCHRVWLGRSRFMSLFQVVSRVSFSQGAQGLSATLKSQGSLSGLLTQAGVSQGYSTQAVITQAAVFSLSQAAVLQASVLQAAVLQALSSGISGGLCLVSSGTLCLICLSGLCQALSGVLVVSPRFVFRAQGQCLSGLSRRLISKVCLSRLVSQDCLEGLSGSCCLSGCL